jgi:hypothetical protein
MLVTEDKIFDKNDAVRGCGVLGRAWYCCLATWVKGLDLYRRG